MSKLIDNALRSLMIYSYSSKLKSRPTDIFLKSQLYGLILHRDGREAANAFVKEHTIVVESDPTSAFEVLKDDL